MDRVQGNEEFVNDVAQALQNMSALRAIQSFLRRHSLPSGRSWDEINTSLQQHVETRQLSRNDLLELLKDLRSRLQKLVSIYEVSEDVHTAMLAYARGTQPKSNPFSSRFPFDLSDGELEGLDVKPRLTATRINQDGIEMFFTSARVGTRVEEIQTEDLSEEARERYTSADRMYAERVERRQAFDIVFVPHEQRIVQIRIDSLATTGRDRAEWIRMQLEALMIAATDLTSLDFFALDLFPAVRSIYDDTNAGRLLGLQFDCATGANRRELIRKTGRTTDLRAERYHVEGTAVVAITPYWLAAEFDVPEQRVPESVQIVLPGTIRNLQGQTGLESFEVSNFVSETAIRHAVDVLFEHVRPA